MYAAVEASLPNSNYWTALAWAKRGEETAQLHVKRCELSFHVKAVNSPNAQAENESKKLVSSLRRVSRGLDIVLREIETEHFQHHSAPESVVSVLSVIAQICERTLAQLELFDQPLVKSDLERLEDQLIRLEDFVENQQLAREVKDLYDQTAGILSGHSGK